MTPRIRLKSTARYHGLEVTILGNVGEGALAIAGYGTPRELAIATIAVSGAGGGASIASRAPTNGPRA